MNQSEPLKTFLRQRHEWNAIGIIMFTVQVSLHIIFRVKIVFDKHRKVKPDAFDAFRKCFTLFEGFRHNIFLFLTSSTTTF